MTDLSNSGPVRAGRVGPFRESHEPKLDGLSFLATGVKPVSGYLKWSGVQPIGNNWGMAHNDVLGCCGFSAWQHYNAAIAAFFHLDFENVDTTTWAPKFKDLPPAYFAYGISIGEPGPHPDFGVDNANMLAWAYKLGLIDGYLEVPLEYADWFARTFHGALIGQVLDGNQATRDFEATPRIPWAAMGTSDGHDTLLIRGDGEGGGAEVTWGGVIPFLLSYRETNWTDCWVIIDKEDPTVDQAALKAVLEEMHGVVKP